MEKEIAEYLKQKYYAEAVIVHGSRAKGRNRPNSDWDLIVITRSDIKGVAEEYNGQKLDVMTVGLPVSAEYISQYTSFLNSARVLLDNNEEVGAQMISEAKARYALGRNLTHDEIDNRKQYLARTIDRMEGVVENPQMFFLYLGFFYSKVLQYWFELRGKYSKPAYEALPDIQNADKDYYALLTTLSSQSSNIEKLEAAKTINNLLIK